MASVLTESPSTAFEPDVHTRNALESRLTNPPKILLGPRRAWTPKDPPTGVPVQVIFVSSNGGGPSRPIRGVADERKVTVNVTIRTSSQAAGAFRIGQNLARNVHDALDQRPYTGYCEVRATTSHPIYLGQDTDANHEWEVILELTVDVTVV